MCGIVGYYATKSQRKLLTPDHIRAASSKIKHRGPDGEGYFFLDNIALAHRRLAILDLSDEGVQPIKSYDKKFTLIYNGEIYNYKQLHQKYGLVFAPKGDARTFVELWAKNGDSILPELNGMFAGAVFDHENNTITIFRDRFGLKPLLYTQTLEGWVFASELKALLAFNIERKINTSALADYLKFEFCPNPSRILEGVWALSPGAKLVLKNNKAQLSFFYEPNINLQKYANASENSILEQLNDLLNNAINLQLQSDAPIGGFLSGGVDSSIITALVPQNINYPVFSAGFDIPQYDETQHAQKVGKILGRNPNILTVNSANAKLFVEKIYDYYDEPFAVPSVIPTYFLCQNARKQVKVALSGEGGDELFMGYSAYLTANKVYTFNKNTLGLGRWGAKAFLHLKGNLNSLRQSRYFSFGNTPFTEFVLNCWSQSQQMFLDSEINKLIIHKFVANEFEFSNTNARNDFEKILLYLNQFDRKAYFAQNLSYKIDIASMANSLEVRAPLMDNELYDFAINLPITYKIKDNVQKYILKKSLSQYLSENLVNRTKWGFPAPIEYWLLNDLKYLLDEYLNERNINDQGLFHWKAIQKLKNEFISGKLYHSKRIWALISFQMWFRKYMN